jgi:hypothetical protein
VATAKPIPINAWVIILMGFIVGASYGILDHDTLATQGRSVA